jgi:regulator of sirC expression with transglutaminase-like and TPR domain
MSQMLSFAELVIEEHPPLDELALALAAEFREVDAREALARLDALGAQLEPIARRAAGDPPAQARACAELLGLVEGYAGDREHYDDPANSMLDLVLERRRGLPILLSVVYVEVARRAGVPLGGVGLPGHFVVGHFGAAPPLLLDPFDGGTPFTAGGHTVTRPWKAREIAMRMLNNLVGSFERRGDLGAALRAAEMRLELPGVGEGRERLLSERLALQARLN